jgi:hypothetical protein
VRQGGRSAPLLGIVFSAEMAKEAWEKSDVKLKVIGQLIKLVQYVQHQWLIGWLIGCLY